MSYTAAIAELRQLLSDNDTDKRSTQKQVLGNTNAPGATNVEFRTYDKRFIEDTFQPYINGVAVAPSGFTITDNISGEFVFATPPAQNSKITASYYWQWWTDDELINFLNKGAEQIGIDDPTVTTGGPTDSAYLMVPQGLRSAALYYAAGWSQDKLVQYMMNRRHSGEYLLEQDKGGDEGFAQIIQQMRSQKTDYFKMADKFRNDFYTRQGRRNAPVFRVRMGRKKPYGPMR